MTELLLNADGDLDLSTGDLQIVHGRAAVAQRLEIRFRSFLGEWFLDTRFGFPWFQSVLGRKGSVDYVEFLLRRTILSTPGVLGITSFSFAFDRAARALTVSFRASTSDGDVDVNSSSVLAESP